MNNFPCMGHFSKDGSLSCTALAAVDTNDKSAFSARGRLFKFDKKGDPRAEESFFYPLLRFLIKDLT